ncbi:uncharacterized protein LOC100908437 [Galendromus occidentalis]|uniref:Uncharacterized protein LOC100908437 n=1 Tax=Galendromus occidentalis TaxID=34638 RepID=A0AAJ6QNE3_9ACAR|nr:uncharacterized protein LOC100908437 [Galendromus occidentalis]
MTEASMKRIFEVLAVVAVAACCCQADDSCQLKGYDLEPLSKSHWAVLLDKALCKDTSSGCILLFSACFTSTLCPAGAFACLQQNGVGTARGGEPAIVERSDVQGFSLHYKTEEGNATQNTIIEFTCDAENILRDDSQDRLAVWIESKDTTKLDNGVRVFVKHAMGCKKREGLGTGSQFIIILLVLFLLYFLGGITYNHVNGARGEELIPHLWFWKNFPSYVVDGCIFVVRVITCQTRDNYSQNPDYGSTSQAGVSPSGRTYETL